MIRTALNVTKASIALLLICIVSPLSAQTLHVPGGTVGTSSNGNVGIGTTTPGKKLDVNGAIKANRFVGENADILNSFMTVNSSSNVYLYSPPNDRDAWLYLDSADTGSNWGIYHRQIDSSVSHLPANSIGFVGGGNSDLKAYISLASGDVFFKGNVGIGTTNPTHKLAVNGAIKAKEVIVETTGWSDYVFAEDYALAPLAQVEAHIKEHKHLPGIPSAAQVSEQGVSLGEMQAKLLAKIEELTLHLIAQEKSMKALQTQNDLLQTQLQQLGAH